MLMYEFYACCPFFSPLISIFHGELTCDGLEMGTDYHRANQRCDEFTGAPPKGVLNAGLNYVCPFGS
jgi:hypothetical protein